MKLPYHWLRELVKVPGDPDSVAAALALRGFEVASVTHGRQPVIDFEITANRPDCLSVIGLAREASAAYGVPLALPDRTTPAALAGETIQVTLDDADLCPRYCAQVFDLRIGTSPSWLAERLETAGLRPINHVVDVTNYVMLEMGQPMHAFDVERLAGRALRIRRSQNGERLRTLDGVERTLEADMLVIADGGPDGGRAQAIAGVMGGADSQIHAGTRRMVLESAYFNPASVRRTSKRLGLKTEASARFERGADVQAPPDGIARAAALLHQIGAAEPVGPMVDLYPSPRAPLTLTLRASRLRRVLGTEVPDADVPGILEPLGFAVRSAELRLRDGEPGPKPRATEGSVNGSRVWTVQVPTFRVDVLREVDLIEEVARHDGYVNLPATFPELSAPQPPPDARTLRDRLVRHVLTASGFSEAVTFAFIERQAALPFAEGGEPVAIANPLSEKYAVLRPSLLPGLIDACAHNRRRERRDVRLFETGTRFPSTGERRAAAVVWCGTAAAAHWSVPGRNVDFFDVKGIVETLSAAFGLAVTLAPANVSSYVAGRSAEIHAAVAASGEEAASGVSRQLIGGIGQITPSILEARGFPANEELYAFELDLDLIAALQPDGELRAEALPRFPSVVRDLSVLVADSLPAAAVRGTIRSAAPEAIAHLAQIVEFDRYRGQGVPDGRVSLSLRLTFRSPDRTLTDAEVDQSMEAVVAALSATHGAQRR